jgi:hypothetical protein
LPTAGERFEWLEEALQICLQMWSGSDAQGQYQGLAGLGLGAFFAEPEIAPAG